MSDLLFFQVGVTGFEPTASWSRTKRATNCATPRKEKPQQLGCCGVVGDERIELPRAESESAALPLCESPSQSSLWASALNAHILYRVGNRLSTAISNFFAKICKNPKIRAAAPYFFAPPACTNCSCWRKRCARTPGARPSTVTTPTRRTRTRRWSRAISPFSAGRRCSSYRCR